MINYIAGLIIALGVICSTSVSAPGAESKGYNVFLTGHSFFIAGGYMKDKIILLSDAAGKTEHKMVGYKYSGGKSGAVDKWWNKGPDQEPRKSVAAGDVDVLAVCTYWMSKYTEQKKSIRNFVELMQKNNPAGQVYVIATKVPSDGPYKGGWDARTKAELANLYGWRGKNRRSLNETDALVDEINTSYGKRVINEVPLYYAQALLRAAIIDGNVPGVKKQSEMYSDKMGHVAEVGQRVNAYAVYASIYRESPIGLYVPKWEKPGDAIQRAQNLALQKAAWEAVQARTVRVTGKPREKRTSKSRTNSKKPPRYPFGDNVPEAGKLVKMTAGALPHYLYLPDDYEGKANARKKYPLVVYLHDKDAIGDLDLMYDGPIKNIRAGTDYPFIMIAPQCPSDKGWDLAGAARVKALIGAAIRPRRIDANRIYVTGNGMGGAGALHMVQRFDNYFAACAPVCGSWAAFTKTPGEAKQARKVAFWAFHGDKVETPAISETRATVDALRAGGANVKLTVYSGAGCDSWNQAHTYDDPQLYKWLLAQKRGGGSRK